MKFEGCALNQNHLPTIQEFVEARQSLALIDSQRRAEQEKLDKGNNNAALAEANKARNHELELKNYEIAEADKARNHELALKNHELAEAEKARNHELARMKHELARMKHELALKDKDMELLDKKMAFHKEVATVRPKADPLRVVKGKANILKRKHNQKHE